MADLKKFEEMLERLINEDKDGAEELFHEIVVEKSRDIYESLLESDLEDEEVDEATDEEVDESDDEEVDEATDEEVDESDDEDLDEGFDLDEFEVEADPMAMDMGGDPADDMMGDVEEPAGDMDDMGGEGDIEDRVEDLEDALDDLKAEFDKMMAGDDMDGDDEGDDEEGGMDMDMDMDDEGDDDAEKEGFAFEADDEEVDEAADEEVEETSKAPKSNTEQMREYVEKVVGGHGAEAKGKGEDGGVNKKSTVAGKNDMGGTVSNLNQGDTGDVVEAGKGALKGNGLADANAKEESAGNVNTPGSKNATKMSGVAKGHGAEKKGAGENAANKKSTIGS